jgi:catechol 2,3-dioxygenase-like lactoylglutathione lyase family enzyme
LARRTAEKAVDGRLEIAAAEIPKSVIDGADRHQEVATAREPVRAIHLVPELLAGESVFAEQEGPKIGIDDHGDFPIDGAVESGGAAIGDDLEIQRGDRRLARSGIGRIAIRLRPQIVVDVKRIDLILLVDALHRFMVAVEFPNFDGRDLQWLDVRQSGRDREGGKEVTPCDRHKVAWYNKHMLISRALSALTLIVTATATMNGQTATTVERPKIPGVAHIGLKTDDLAAARNFYGRDLGFQEAFSLDKATGGLLLIYFKINDHQYIEIFPELKDPAEDRLSHIAFETDNARQLRDYLASRGVKVPDALKPGLDGNLSFTVKDPDGHTVEFMEYIAGSLHSRNFGKSLPETRVSQRIIHVGVTVQDRDAADRFYKDILGFRETWHGGNTDARTDWIDMRVPDGTDWLEYMMNVRNPSPKTLGVMNHMGLGVPSVKSAQEAMTARGVSLPSQQAKIGRDGKWQLNMYDPNLTRVELMEFEPVQAPCCSPFIKP